MAQIFHLPDLGEGLTEASIVQWLVSVGDEIVVDQPIAEVETAKSIVELPSPFTGTVTTLHANLGDVVRVGAPLLETAGVVQTPDNGEFDAHEAELAAHRQEERAGSGNVLIGYGTPDHGGAPRRKRASAAPVGHPPSAPALASALLEPRRAPLVRSPLVRQLARERGIDVATLTGTGPDGVITRGDVLAASAAPANAALASAAVPPPSLAVATREPLSPLRRAANATLARSRAEIPEATVWVDVDATELWSMRAHMTDGDTKAPSLTALIARFALLALAEHPLLAGRLDGDEIVTYDGVALGVATDTPRGLMVPNLGRSDQLSVADLDVRLREVAEAARSGRIPPEQSRGSTFTLNNYGALGVDGSAAIINHPEVAILGVGRMIERPWVVDGAVVPRRIVQLSLVFDHRICDGGYAASFLRHIVTSIEQPLTRFPLL